jgi:CHRD domain-containing protein
MVRRVVVATLLGGLLLLGPNAALANYHEGKEGSEQAKPPEKAQAPENKGDEKPKGEQPKSDADKQEEARQAEGDRHEGENEGDGDEGDGRRHYGGRYYDRCGYHGCGYYDYDRGYNSSFVANLTPDQELKPGPAGARGRAVLDVDSRQHRVCYRLDYQGIKPTGAHIHHGRAGENGPVAVALDQGDRGCVGASRGLLREIQASPHDFYVNLHTTEHPDGAIRGQLEYPSEARH